jgi:hypothetical protein
VTVHAVCPAAAAGDWRVTWAVHNDGPMPISLEAAWVPHGRFRGEGRMPLALTVEPAHDARIELMVHAEEPAGAVVENAFLIVRSPGWRIFTRMRVQFARDGSPRPIVELVTTQRLR